jgi:arylsulfatase A-like enzyme
MPSFRPPVFLLRAIVCLCGGLLAPLAWAAPADRPNIVVILADDLGAADLACYGADLHETPYLDRLAAGGVRFTQAYAAASVCTPTRAALMTGKHPARLGMTIWAEAAKAPPAMKNKKLIPATAEHNLALTETTIASHLQQAGYLTAIVGKWHLGDAEHYPETHGFDINIGGTLWGAPQTFFYPYRGRGLFGKEFRYIPHLEFGKPGEYLPERLTDEAIKIIDRAGQQPFFLYLAHHSVHTPIEAKAEDVSYFESRVAPAFHHRNPTYAAMVRSLDESVGRVVDHLRQRGLLERTLIVFASDNGGYIGQDRFRKQPCTDNWPLRSGKGALYEGGIRTPLIVRWPGVTPQGATCDELAVTTDLFYTLLAAAGIAVPGDSPRDGVDLRPVLEDPQASLGRDALYFHYPHYYETTSPVSAVREGAWKLLEFYEDNHTELYNLQSDPGEQHDLASEQSDRAKGLHTKLVQWRDAVGARLPTPNPDYKPPMPKQPKSKAAAKAS